MKLGNYVSGECTLGGGDGEPLLDPVLGCTLATASTTGLDLAAGLRFARERGGPALRRLDYRHRGALLQEIAGILTAHRDEYYRIALENSGSPRRDAAVDIDGAIFTLKYYARQAELLGEKYLLRDGNLTRLGKDEDFQVLHVGLPIRGVAILINAFNFPAWGLWEKAAPALLAGVPVFAKPATATAWLAQRMVKDIVDAQILPRGALSIVCGKARDLMNHVTDADAVAFTGSAETAAQIRSSSSVLHASPRLNIEADSTNLAVLGPDAAPGTAEFDLIVREIVNEMTVKAGQKCTAIRRVLAPVQFQEALAEAVHARLSSIKTGNPRNKDVQMGPVVSKKQQQAVRQDIAQLRREASILFDGGPQFSPIDADPDVSAFVAPTFFRCERPLDAKTVHTLEVFGPVATLLPYRNLSEAVQIASLGQGSLVASVFSADEKAVTDMAMEMAAGHGKIHIVDASVGNTHTGHGNVMPMALHGGPGRAGGGQELGGLRALRFYHQYSAIQAPTHILQRIAERSAEPRL